MQASPLALSGCMHSNVVCIAHIYAAPHLCMVLHRYDMLMPVRSMDESHEGAAGSPRGHAQSPPALQPSG